MVYMHFRYKAGTLMWFTLAGTLTVRYIPPPLPRSILGKGHILFAHLRQLHLTFHLLMSGESSAYDVYFVDQLSTCIPLLRNVAHKRVVFYGHFPDKLLADGQFVEGCTGVRKSLSLKGIYRIPMDWLEEVTTRAFVVVFNEYCVHTNRV